MAWGGNRQGREYRQQDGRQSKAGISKYRQEGNKAQAGRAGQGMFMQVKVAEG